MGKHEAKFPFFLFWLPFLFVTGCATAPSVSDNVISELSKESSLSSVLYPQGNFFVVSRGTAAAAGLFGSYGDSPEAASKGREYMRKYDLKDPALTVIEYFGVGLKAAHGLNNFNTEPILRGGNIENVYKNPEQLRSSVSNRFVFGFQTHRIYLGGGLQRYLQYALTATLHDIEKSEAVWRAICFTQAKVKGEMGHDESGLKLLLNEVAKECAEDLLHIVGEGKYDTAIQAVSKAYGKR